MFKSGETFLLAALVMAATPIALPTAANAAGIGHSFFMRGQIVDMTGGVPTVCVGRSDGAKVGQTLDVVRVTTIPGTRGGSSFRREDVGKVRIDAIVDDHFARASVISGRPAKHDIVELRQN